MILDRGPKRKRLRWPKIQSMNSAVSPSAAPSRFLLLPEAAAEPRHEPPRVRRYRLTRVGGPRLALNPVRPLAAGDFAHLKRVYD